MNTMIKMLWAGLFIFAAISCEEDSDDGNNGGSDSDSDTGGDDSDDTDTFDLATLTDKVYYIQFDKGYWTTPEYAGEEVGSYVPGFLLKISNIDTAAGTFSALLGTADDSGAQNACNKTVTVTGTLDAGGAFVTDAIDFDAIITGAEDSEGSIPQAVAPIHNFSIGGTFVSGGDRFKSGVMDAVMDFRDIACLFSLIEDKEDRNAENICSLMKSTVGYDCEVCSFETDATVCVTMKAQGFKASAVDASMTEVDDFDMTCVNSCE